MPRRRRTDCRPGRICGDPTAGLCERVVVEVPRVFDGCVYRSPSESFVVRLDAMPGGLTPPFVFLELISDGAAVLSDVRIHNTDGPKSRVTCTVTIPVKCRFRDASGREATGYGAVTERREVLLFVPEENWRERGACRITAKAALCGMRGSFIGESTVAVSCRIEEEFEVVCPSRLLIPVYGEFDFPECEPQRLCRF